MRLYNYINEQSNYTIEDIDKIISIIQEDCKPYLKDVKNKYKRNFLFSGRKRTYNFFDKKKVRKNRRPKDTPTEAHEFIDDWFYENFGIKFRSNSIFCFFSPVAASYYGNSYMIFPIDRYNIISSPVVEDLYETFEDYFDRWKHASDMDKESYLEWIEDYLDNNIKYKLNTFTDTNKEVMLNCKEYHLLDYSDAFDLKQTSLYKELLSGV